MKNYMSLAAAVVLLGASGCSGDPALFLGGPAGPVTSVQLSTSSLDLLAGNAATIGAQARDDAGNTASAAATFAACDGGVTVADGTPTDQWAQVATVTANAIGESCVTVTAGGISETVRVRMSPGSILITGPDTVLSGAAAVFGVEFYSTGGTALTPPADYTVPEVVSLNELRLGVTATDAITYDAAGQQPGTVRLRTSTDPAVGTVVTSEKYVTIVPGVFGGTMSASTAAQGGQIDVTSVVTLDGDEFVTVGGVVASNWTGEAGDARFVGSGTSLSFLIPWNLAPGTYEVIINNQGPFQIAEVATSVTVTAGTVAHNRQGFPGGFTPGTAIEDKIPGLRSSGVTYGGPLILAFPVIWDPGVTGSTTTYYTFNNCGPAWVPGSSSGCSTNDQGFAAETAVRIRLDWVDSCGDVCGTSVDEDFDIQFIDGGFTAFRDLDGATLAKPESSLYNFDDGDFQFVRFQTFSGAGGAHVTIEFLGQFGLCADDGGCTIGGEV